MEIYKDILEQYRYLLEENYDIIMSYLINYLKSKKIFRDNDKMRNILKEEVRKYLLSSKNELKIYNFLLLNRHKLYSEDIYGLLDILLHSFEKRYLYIENLFENLETAISMELEYKFYLPQNKPSYIETEDIEQYIQYAKGFNLQRVYDFLCEVEVCNDNLDYENVVKVIEVNSNNIEFFGIFDNNKIAISKVRDEQSTLIAVHLLVKYILMKKLGEDKNDPILIQGDLPIFYELLFQKRNSFSKLLIHTTKIALQLLDSYQEEPIDIQIEKVRKIYKEHNI